jgi:hypothetical protein
MKERKFFRLSGLSKRSRIAIKGRSQVAHSSLLAAVLLGTARRRQRHQHPIGRRTGSMYDSEWFLVNNPLNRYALSTRNALGEECRRLD